MLLGDAVERIRGPSFAIGKIVLGKGQDCLGLPGAGKIAIGILLPELADQYPANSEL